jgi:Ca2+-binding RTX toxin-like protein
MKKRILVLLAVVALMVVMFAPMATAATIQCTTVPCYGTAAKDTILERAGDGLRDKIYGLERGDIIDASKYGNDLDVLYGNRGADTLITDDGDANDTVFGGAGIDTCRVDSGDNVYGCEVIYVDGVLVT